MKHLSNLHDVLSYQLSAMFDAEHRLALQLCALKRFTQDDRLLRVLDEYTEKASWKIIKLERIFNYLMTEPVHHPDAVAPRLLAEAAHTLQLTALPHLRDIVTTTSLRSVNYYQMGAYTSAQIIALDLMIEPVSDLLSEIVTWERETCQALNAIALDEIIQPRQAAAGLN